MNNEFNHLLKSIIPNFTQQIYWNFSKINSFSVGNFWYIPVNLHNEWTWLGKFAFRDFFIFFCIEFSLLYFVRIKEANVFKQHWPKKNYGVELIRKESWLFFLLFFITRVRMAIYSLLLFVPFISKGLNSI